MTPLQTPLRPLHARLILVAAVLLVMGRLIVCDFTFWDDQVTVHQNPQMKLVGWDTFRDNWTRPTLQIYIPLTYTVWALVAMAAKLEPDAYGITLNPWFFHATNVFVHAAGAVAAWALLRRLVKSDVAALLGALFWAVHPVQVESVGWVSGLKDVLSGTLVLTAMAMYVRWRQETSRFDDKPARWHGTYAAALGIYVLALLAKPSAFTMPVLLLVIDGLVLRTPWRRVATALAAFAMVTLPIAVVARVVQPPPNVPSTDVPAWMRPLVATDALAFYVAKVVAPLALCCDYGRTPAAIRASGVVWASWAVPAAILLLTVVVYRRLRRWGRDPGPLPAAGLLLFALAPAHVLGLTRFEFQTLSTVADHYLYVAMIGPALLLAWALSLRPTRGVVTTAAACVALYGARAAWQTPAWQDETTLIRQTLSVNPRSWSSYVNLAAYNGLTGHFKDERADLETAQRLQPNDLNSKIGLLNLNAKFRQYDVARRYAEEIVVVFSRQRGDDPGTLQGYAKVFDLYLALGRLDDAEEFLKRAEARSPTDREIVSRRTLLEWRRRDARTRTAPASRGA